MDILIVETTKQKSTLSDIAVDVTDVIANTNRPFKVLEYPDITIVEYDRRNRLYMSGEVEFRSANGTVLKTCRTRWSEHVLIPEIKVKGNSDVVFYMKNEVLHVDVGSGDDFETYIIPKGLNGLGFSSKDYNVYWGERHSTMLALAPIDKSVKRESIFSSNGGNPKTTDRYGISCFSERSMMGCGTAADLELVKLVGAFIKVDYVLLDNPENQ